MFSGVAMSSQAQCSAQCCAQCCETCDLGDQPSIGVRVQTLARSKFFMLVSITLKIFYLGSQANGKTTTTTKHNTRQFSKQCPEGPQQRHDLSYERSQTDGEDQELRQI